MIKLKSLVREAEESPDSNLWDDWQEYLYYFEYDIDKTEISKIIKRFDLNGKGFFNNRIVRIDGDKPVFLTYDASKETFDLIKNINQWLYDVDASEIIDSSNIYNNWVGASLRSLRKNPPLVYHYTTDEKLELIQQSGEVKGSYGTGLTNRGEHGIFTSTDPEEYALGTYGNICLEINLPLYKQESGLPELNLEFEPDVMDYLIREYLSSVLELEIRVDIPSDMSPYTIIVNHIIPLKDIRKI